MVSVDDRYLFTIRDEVVNKGAAPVTLYPYALISRHGTPKIEGWYILHEGLIGKLGDERLQEVAYSDIEKEKSKTFNATNAWLGITDKYWAATLLPDTTAKVKALFSFNQSAPSRPTRPIISRSADHRPGRARSGQCAPVRRRQGSGHRRRLRPGTQSQPFRAADPLGYFYFVTKPMFLAMDWILSPRRQFRRRHPDHHGHHQDHLLPARQQVLRLDGEDEGGAAGDDGDPRALWRRQDEAATGDDGALQEGEDQSDRRLPADPHSNPRSSLRSTRCCSSPSKCGTRRSSAGSRTCPRPIRPRFSTCSG